VKNLNNETTKRVSAPVPNVDCLYDGGASGRIILRADDRAVLFEVQSRRVIGELTAPKIKNIVWSPDGSKVALLCKYGVVIANRQLEQLCSISDTVRIKSGAWDVSPTGGTNSNLFVYTTLHHVKYCLPTGDTGTIRTLDNPIYATRVVKDSLFCLDREARSRVISIDTTEARFKLALANKKYGQVMHMVKHSRLCGRAIVAYLQSKGFPEVALHFVRDPQTRFRLALACGNIEAAMESAFSLEQQQGADGKSRDVWGELGSEALRQGNHQVVEMSYQRKKDFDRLSFLYMLTGDTEKLRKMLKISNMRNDIMGRYHNALLLGDAAERVAVLEASGNLPLAYISAKLHGLDEVAERIKVAIETQEGSVDGLMEKVPVGTKKGGRLLQPPTPIVRASNWPTLEIKKTTLEDLSAADVGDEYEEEAPAAVAADTGASAGAAAWDDDFGMEDAGVGGGEDFDLGDDDDMGWGDDLDGLGDIGGDEVKPDQVDDMAAFNEISGDIGFQMPPAGRPPAGCWAANSSHAADHMAAGGASSAMQLLHRQIAASDFSNLKGSMLGCYLGSTVSLPGVPGSGSMIVPLMRNDATGHPGNDSLPRTSSTIRSLVADVRMGYKYFQTGKFNEAKNAFTEVLSQIPLTVTDNRSQANEIKEMLEICREYITAIRLKEAITAAGADPVRSTELSAYFTHCNLQPVHLLLALRSAMGTAFKHKNFIVAASFARRLLELPDMRSERNADLRMKATKVLQRSEQMARNEHTLNYKENAAFSIDCKDFVPVYTGEECVKCSYCGSTYKGSSMKGQVCVTDGFCTVGLETIGLVTGK